MSKKKIRLNKGLSTPFESDKSTSWNDYPRPQLRRDSYFCLNGEWDLSVDTAVQGSKKSLGKINVPFSPETRLSGIERELQIGEYYIYDKKVTFPENFNKGRILLHFGAVDQIARVYVNGNIVGSHIGGYLPFSFDITAFVWEGENHISVVVIDELDRELAYGKQRRDRGGMWYTPISGIWQSVWCESVPKTYIKSIKITPTTHDVKIEVVGGEDEKTIILGEKEYKFVGNSTTIEIDDPICWTPECPHLYDFTLVSGDDKIESYFALRQVSIEERGGKSFICLNGEPILCHGLLDQGYFSDGIYLPATPKGFENDILEMKALGFNMLRKHIKIEPEIFYYYCDKYGMLVFQDMVNCGKYSFFVDTALPTAGLKRGISHKASKKRREHFERDSRATLDLLYNHPSIIYYTIFNEGWGQFDADRNYNELKAYDPTRVYDATSGWFWGKNSDVHSEHIYFKKLRMKAREGRPLVLSEFGGYSCKLPEHSFNLDKTYGYRYFDTMQKFERALIKLYDDEVIPHIEKEGLCALVLTQVSDVEDETNGLLTYDREILKVNKDEILKMSNRLYKAFEKVTK